MHALFLVITLFVTPAQTAPDLLNQARSLLLRGDRESVQQGRQLARKAKSIFESQGKQTESMVARRLLAFSPKVEPRPEELRQDAQEMLDIARQIKSRFWEASAIAVLGFADMRMRQLDAALVAAQEARAMQNEPAWKNDPLADRESETLERAFAAFLNGALHHQMGKPRDSEILLKEAESLATASPTPREPYKTELLILRVLVLRELGLMSLRSRSPRRAIGYFETSLGLLPQMGGPPIASVHGFIAEAYLQLRQPDRAKPHAEKSLSLALSGNYRPLVGEAYTRLGHMAAGEGDEQAAEAYFQKAASSGPRGGRGMTSLGDMYNAKGRPKAALEQYAKAVDHLEQRDILPPPTGGPRSDRMIQPELEPYMKSLDAALMLYFGPSGKEIKYARQAFETDQRIRNRLFARQLAAAWNTLDRGTTAFDANLAALDRQMTSISRSLLNSSLAPSQRESMTTNLERLEIQHAVLRRKIAMFDNVDESSNNFRELSIEEIQKLIPANGALLEYNFGGFPAAFVLTKDQFQVVRFPKPDQLDRRVGTYFDVLSKTSGHTFDTFGADAGHALFNEMVDPILRVLPATVSHLIISPPPPLEMLPFEALPTDRRGHFLIEKYAVSYLPSASALPILLERRNPGRGRQLLAYADPAYGGTTGIPATRGLFDDEGLTLNALPYTKVEVDSVADIVGREHAEVYVGADASEGRLKKMDLTQYRILHFATHAIGSRLRPDRSALVFSMGSDQTEDGLLQAREIYDLRLNADLVVLSACQTGGGGGTPGEGVHGLSRAFLFAGTRSLIASMWKVEDEPTAILMARFYDYLREGLSKAESLRRAKVDLIRQGLAHPRQWASFVLFGEGNEALDLPAVVTAPAKTKYTYVALLSVLALILVSSLVWALHVVAGFSPRSFNG